MHYDMGKFVRATYVDKYNFLSGTYYPSEAYIQSTDRPRTIDSARSQVSGLYDAPLVWPNVETQFPVNVISDPVDYVIHLTDDLCPKFGQIQKAAQNDKKTVAMYDQMNSDWEKSGFFPRIRQLTNMPNATATDLRSVIDYLDWANRNNRTLQFSLTDSDIRNI